MFGGRILRSWPRYVRFSVRGLMVLVLMSAVWLGWLVRSARIQRETVTAIERAGGSAGYDLGWTDDRLLQKRGSWAPTWLVDVLGVDYFVSVVDLAFSGTCTDRELGRAGSLSRLEQLSLARSRISDAGLAHLRGLAHLSWLNLCDTKITDAGLVHLEGLTTLEGLDLSFTPVTDAGLAHLKGLKGLTELDLSGTRITDAGLTHLKGLSNLAQLRVLRTHVTGAGIQSLKQVLPRLTIDR